MSYISKLLLEIVSVSAMVVVVGELVYRGVCAVSRTKPAPDTAIRIASFALAGACVHIICEFTGINKWYLTNSAASHN